MSLFHHEKGKHDEHKQSLLLALTGLLMIAVITEGIVEIVSGDGDAS
jgi:hypothetical protein